MCTWRSAQSDLIPYAELINSLLVQVLNWSLHVGNKEPEQQKPLRYALTCHISVDCLAAGDKVMCVDL